MRPMARPTIKLFGIMLALGGFALGSVPASATRLPPAVDVDTSIHAEILRSRTQSVVVGVDTNRKIVGRPGTFGVQVVFHRGQVEDAEPSTHDVRVTLFGKEGGSVGQLNGDSIIIKTLDRACAAIKDRC